MPPLSPEQECRLVDALVSLDWMTTLDRKSCELIREQLGCTMADAIEVLGYIHLGRKLIRARFPTGEELSPGASLPELWKWERNSK